MHRIRAQRSAGSRRGFTLVELLVVTALIAVVGAVIVACLSGGMRALETARNFGSLESRAALSLEVLERDVANAVPFFGISFRGDEQRLEVPGRVERPGPRPAGAAPPVERIGTVRYAFRRDRAELLRTRWVFPSSDEDAAPESILAPVADVRFQYRDEAGAWAGSWDSASNFPTAVRIELRFPGGKDAPPIRRTVAAPVRTKGGKKGAGTPGPGGGR